MADGLTIGAVAKQAGMLTTTLRYYESIGLLPEPSRKQNGHRRYDAAVFQRLEMIHTAQQAGFTLNEIRVLFDEILWGDAPAGRWNGLIQGKLQEINATLVHIQRMKNLLEDILQCDDETLAECIFETGQRHKQLG